MTVGALAIGLLAILLAWAAARPSVPVARPATSVDPSRASEVPALRSAGPNAAIDLVAPDLRRETALEDGRAYGRSDAPASLTIWGDFQCPFCGELGRTTEPRLIDDYVVSGQLRIVYRDWVFIGVESVTAAVAARCAGQQGGFWRYHDYLVWNQRGENEGGFSDDRLRGIAAATGLDLRAFTACTLDPAQQTAVEAETEAGDAANVQMTPTLEIGGQLMAGLPKGEAGYQQLRAVIEASISRASASAAS